MASKEDDYYLDSSNDMEEEEADVSGEYSPKPYKILKEEDIKHSYVESNPNRKWCPAAGCDQAVEFDVVGSDSYDVVCDCSHKFCWRCLEEPHRPVGCELVAVWAEKNKSEAERYTHYYERWFSNDKSRKIAMVDLDEARRKYEGQVGMQFVVEAWEQIVECRRVLKWSYVYGYYLPSKKMAMFECLQGQAEAALERLHHCVEKEMIVDDDCFLDCKDFREFRAKLMDLTKANSNFFRNLVMALESDLPQVN